MSRREDQQEGEAIFWCSLLQPLLCGEIPPQEAADFLRKLAETEYLFPDGTRRKPSRATLWRKWKRAREGGERARRAEGTLLLIVDEAHLLTPDALTDLRLLVSSALDDAPPLKVVLSGQEPLRITLRQSSQSALLNRIGVRYHLSPLSKEETSSYIDFQMKQAGGTEKLFEETAKGLIHDYSGGVLRQINNLATACLLLASLEKSARVSEAILQRTFQEFQLP